MPKSVGKWMVGAESSYIPSEASVDIVMWTEDPATNLSLIFFLAS